MVEWSDEVGHYSVVPQRIIDSDGPFADGDTVPVNSLAENSLYLEDTFSG